MFVEKAYLAVISWVDGEIEDADELRVFAESPESAESAARVVWLRTVGVEWPNCRITGVSVHPQRPLPRFA